MIDSLVLGCGPQWPRRYGSHRETYVDRIKFSDDIDVAHDLDVTPWPFADNSYDEVVAVHLVEHLRALVPFMDECWRVLRPGGHLYIVTPEAGSDWDLTHADPTHVRCYRRHTFINYFTRAEAPKFGYTDKHWAIVDLLVEFGCIRLLASPVGK